MKKMLVLAAAAALPLVGCGGVDTAEEAHEERAEQLEEAAEVSVPEGAEQLENLAEKHERKAEVLEEFSGERASDMNVMAPIPDNVSVGDRSR